MGGYTMNTWYSQQQIGQSKVNDLMRERDAARLAQDAGGSAPQPAPRKTALIRQLVLLPALLFKIR